MFRKISNFLFSLQKKFGSKKAVFILLHENTDHERIVVIRKTFFNLFYPVFLEDNEGRILKEMRLEDTPFSQEEKDAFLRVSVIYYYKDKPKQAPTDYFELKSFLEK